MRRAGGAGLILAGMAVWPVAAASAPAGAVAPPAAESPLAATSREGAYYSFCMARQAWYRHDHSSALRHMRLAVEADPTSAELSLELARLHLDIQEPHDAVEAARRAIDLAPQWPAPRRALAEALAALAQRSEPGSAAWERAESALRDLIQLDPIDAEARLNLARLQMARGELEEALEQLKLHLEVSPQSEEGIHTAASILLKLKRPTEAVDILQKGIKARPGDPQLRAALAEAHEETGNYQAALEAATPLLELQADPVRVRLLLARLCQRAGRHDEAFGHLEEMTRAMQRRPSEFSDGDRAEVQLRLVQALMDAGRHTDALERADSATGLFPADRRFLLRKGEALLLLHRPQEAEALFQERFGRPSGRQVEAQQVSDTYLSAGARQERAGEPEEAEAHLRRSIEWNSQNAAALNYLGYMLAERGSHLDQAIDYIKRALEKDPRNGAYLDSLGWAYFKKGEYPPAQRALEEALAAMPQEPAVHSHLGDLYEATGRIPEAIEAWRRALELGAEDAASIERKLAGAQQPAPPRK